MKRYWVFSGQDYYPFGGMYDFEGDYDDVPLVPTVDGRPIVAIDCEFAHVYDSHAGTVMRWKCGRGDDWSVWQRWSGKWEKVGK